MNIEAARLVIENLIATLTAYMTYRVGMAEARPENYAQGEQAMVVVEHGIQQHGTQDEQTDLENFRRNPERYQEQFARALADLATRQDEFAQQLQQLVPQVQYQGTAEVKDHGRVYGSNVGTNAGTISNTINVKDDEA